jgi:TRAP transporter TAXI family solute receptor
MRTNRRTVLRLGAGLAAAAVAGCAAGEYGGPVRGLRLAAGERGGFYLEFARLLATQLAEEEPYLTAEVTVTGGSVANLGLVRDGRADLGLALADVATSAVKGAAPFVRALPLSAIGRVYENYMQLVVPVESPIRTVRDLGGARISLGADGSGAAVFGERLLAVTGVPARVDHHPLSVATAELAAGGIDALLWSGGVPTPALRDLDAIRPVRLVDLAGELPVLQDAYGPVYEEVTVPGGGYGHRGPIVTVGVSNLLVAGPGLPDDVAAAVAAVLVRAAPRLVPRQALGTQYLDRRSLIATGDVPLHPGAARAYRDLRG